MTNDCCKFLLHQLVFFHNAIGPCCSRTIIHTPLKRTFNSLTDQCIEEFLEVRKSNIEIFNKGEKPFCYENCGLYDKSETIQNEPIQLNHITISNRTKCNCNCIYCEHSQGGVSKVRSQLNRLKTYDIVPILKKLKEKSLISKGCEFIISGGECAEYPKKELEYILNLVQELEGSALLLSSGIRYSKQIEDILQSGTARITISVDSGTKKTYEKIKRVKTFNKVWDNLKKYSKAASQNQNAEVEAKYIIIPGINDSCEEIQAFVDKCVSINCKYVRAEIEHYWMYNNFEKTLSDDMINLFKYFEDAAINNNLRFRLEGVGRSWMLTKFKESGNSFKTRHV